MCTTTYQVLYLLTILMTSNITTLHQARSAGTAKIIMLAKFSQQPYTQHPPTFPSLFILWRPHQLLTDVTKGRQNSMWVSFAGYAKGSYRLMWHCAHGGTRITSVTVILWQNALTSIIVCLCIGAFCLCLLRNIGSVFSDHLKTNQT